MSEANLNGVVLQGRYRIEHPLGKGGMSTVYLARHVALDTPVAVKLIRDDLIEDETVRARFEREARAAARLTHPNVVHVFDFGTLERGAFIVMEYIEGVSLRQMLAERGPLEPEEAANIILQTSEAVAAAHAAGILHRDIKPENLMIYDDETGKRRVKVVDFGLAKHLERDSTHNLTGRRQMVGTPKYMAPERVTMENVDGRVDVYALGVVLYEMLAGRAPFEGTFKEIVSKHLYQEPAPLADAGVEVPPALEEVVRRALVKDPEGRTPSAIEFGREVSEAVRLRLTPSGALASIGSQSGPVELTRTIGSSHLSQVGVAGDGGEESNATRYGEGVGDEVTRVRPRVAPYVEPAAEPFGAPQLPTLYIPNEKTAEVEVDAEEEPVVSSRGRFAERSIAMIVVAIVVGLVAFFAAAYGAYLFSNRETAERAAVAEPAATEAAGETAPPSGTVTIPDGAKTRIVLEMDPKEIKNGAVLSISGESLPEPQTFMLKRVRGSLSWVVSDASRSIPGRMRLDEILAPGKTFTLVVRNRDGSTSIPKISIAPSPAS
jgi:tRNA A-37 threonylcarbamoyl transferase component Bud32